MGITSDATSWSNVLQVFERPNSQSIKLVNETGRDNEAPKGTEIPSDETCWSEASFMGPRFPSLPPSPSDKHTPRVEDRLISDIYILKLPLAYCLIFHFPMK